MIKFFPTSVKKRSQQSLHLSGVHFLIAFVLSFGIIGFSLFATRSKVKAQASAMMPFGGQIEEVQYCCDGSILLTVGPPTVGFYDYRPGASTLYEYYDVFTTGPWVLGTAIEGGFCDLSSDDCEGGMEANTIMPIGTSEL